jgi:hypothetical protein
MSTNDPEIPADKLALYQKLVATNPEIECKGASMPYTSLNGHMFSFLMEDGTMALRLSDDGRAIFMRKYKSKLCEQHGRVLAEYVVVPNSLLKKTNELKKAYNASVIYIAALKPKPTAKKKATKKKAAKKKVAATKTAAPKKTAAKKKAAKKKAK